VPVGEHDPRSEPRPPEQLSFWVRLRHIRISHAEVPGARSKRSRAEAQSLAATVTKLARRRGASFAALARTYSDSPSRLRGGLLGPAQRYANLEPAVAEAAFSIGIGQVAGPIESPTGFHILRRERRPEYAAQQILICWKGARRAGKSIARSEAEARSLARELLGKLRAGAAFEELALASSDGPNAKLGGHIGVFVGDLMDDGITNAVRSRALGAFTKRPVRTVFGFHLLRRVPIELAQASHILISFKGAFKAGDKRSRAEAETLAKALLIQARAEPLRFLEFAQKNSDDKRIRLGPIPRRGPQMLPAIQAAVFALKPGQVYGAVVESRFGFHLIRRDR